MSGAGETVDHDFGGTQSASVRTRAMRHGNFAGFPDFRALLCVRNGDAVHALTASNGDGEKLFVFEGKVGAPPKPVGKGTQETGTVMKETKKVSKVGGAMSRQWFGCDAKTGDDHIRSRLVMFRRCFAVMPPVLLACRPPVVHQRVH